MLVFFIQLVMWSVGSKSGGVRKIDRVGVSEVNLASLNSVPMVEVSIPFEIHREGYRKLIRENLDCVPMVEVDLWHRCSV